MDNDKRALELIEKGLQMALCGIRSLSDNPSGVESKVVVNDYLQESCLSREEIKELLVVKTRQGKGEEIRKLLNSFGVKKLSDLPQDKYKDVYEQAKQL